MELKLSFLFPVLMRNKKTEIRASCLFFLRLWTREFQLSFSCGHCFPFRGEVVVGGGEGRGGERRGGEGREGL